MNLTSLFNFNYLKENIKKSKAIILLCMLLLPILNGIILLMHGSTGDNFVASIYDVSGIILFGMYVIPIVLSITLFSFIYKTYFIKFFLEIKIDNKCSCVDYPQTNPPPLLEIGKSPVGFDEFTYENATESKSATTVNHWIIN